MSITNAVLYVCPDCEPGPYMFAGKIITKICSRCADQRQNAKTGYDRARTGADREPLIEAMRAHVRGNWHNKLSAKYRVH